jgi:hypothetical protein
VSEKCPTEVNGARMVAIVGRSQPTLR